MGQILNRFALVTLMIGSVLLVACGDSCAPPALSLDFVKPVDGAKLTAADDSDSVKQGLQYSVELNTTFADGVEFELISGQEETMLAEVKDGKIVFKDFSFASSKDGTANTLIAYPKALKGNELYQRSIKVIAVFENDLSDKCSFLNPVNDALIIQDADLRIEGFQIEWQAECSGNNVAMQKMLVDAGSDVVMVTTDQDGKAQGMVTVKEDQGSNTLTGKLIDAEDQEMLSFQREFKTDSSLGSNCAAEILSPINNTRFGLNSTDADLALDGFQITIVIDSQNPTECAGALAKVTIGDQTLEKEIDQNGLTSFIMTIVEGENTIAAKVINLSGREAEDSTMVILDTIAPELSVDSPIQDKVYTESDDLDTSGFNGISLPLKGALTGSEDASYRLVCTGAGEDYIEEGELLLDQNGRFDMIFESINRPRCTLTILYDDGANFLSKEIVFQISAPNLCLAQIVSPLNGVKVGNLSGDASADAGLQIEVLVDTENAAACADFSAEVSIGQQVFSAEIGDDGIAHVIVTVVNGDQHLVATIINGNLRSQAGKNEIDIEVDTVPPMIMLNSPLENGVYSNEDDIDSDPSNGIEILLAGQISDFTEATYVLTCDGLGSQNGVIESVDNDFSITLSKLDQGSCSLVIVATDGLNNIQIERQFSVESDLPCQANILHPTANTVYSLSSTDSNSARPGFQVIVNVDTANALLCAGHNVVVTVQGTEFDGQVNSLGLAAVEVTLAEGTSLISAKIVDGSRVSETGMHEVNVTLDRIAPVLSVTSPATGQLYGPLDDLDHDVSNGTTLALAGVVEGAVSGEYMLSCTADGAMLEQQSGTLMIDAQGVYNQEIPNIKNQNCELVITATDGQNTVQKNLIFQVSQTHSLQLSLKGDLDHNGYWIASEDMHPQDTTTITIGADIIAGFTAMGAHSLKIDVFDAQGMEIPSLTQTFMNVVSGQVLSFETAFPRSDDRAYSIRATLLEGAATVASLSQNLKVDTLAPVFSWIFPQHNGRYSSNLDADLNLDGYQQQFSVASNQLEDGAVVFFTIEDHPEQTSTCTHKDNSCVSRTTTLPSGSYSVQASSTDTAGNTKNLSLLTFSLDLEAPKVQSWTLQDDLNNDAIINYSESGGVQGEVVSDVTIQFSVAPIDIEDGQDAQLFDRGVLLATGQTLNNQIIFSQVALPEGNLELSVFVTDTAGNDIATNQYAVFVDTFLPTIVIGVPTKSTLLLADDKDPVIAANLQIDVLVETDVANGQSVELFDGIQSVGTASVLDDVATFANVTLSNGQHSLKASVTDIAGNTSTSEVYQTLVDIDAPVLTIVNIVEAQEFGATDDVDTLANGFQIDIEVNHTDLEVGQEILIFDAQNRVLGRAITGASPTTTVRITSFFVDGEVIAIHAEARDVNGNQGLSPVINIRISTGAYSVLLEKPSLVAGLIQVGKKDLNTDNKVESELTVFGWSSAPEPKVVEVFVNGILDPTAEYVTMADQIFITRSVTDGDQGNIEFRVKDGDDKVGTSGVLNYNVDLSSPVIAIQSIVTAAGTTDAGALETFNIASDLNQLVAGLQAEVLVNVVNCENGMVAVYEALEQISESVQISSDGIANDLSIAVSDETENNADWVVKCTDLAENEGQDKISTVVDLTAPGTVSLSAQKSGNARMGAVDVTVTVAGENGNVGDGMVVEVVASRTEITPENFNDLLSEPANLSLAGLVGSQANVIQDQVVTVQSSFLTFDQQWNFAARIKDDVGNTTFVVQTLSPLDSNLFSFNNIENDVANGGVQKDAMGFLSSAKGDFNGDGYDDLAISAFKEGDNCSSATYCPSVVRLLAGRDDLSEMVVSKELTGAATSSEYYGWYGVLIANVNGDAFDDLILFVYDPQQPNVAEIHIHYGTDAMENGQPILVEETAVEIIVGSSYPYSPAFLGDVNGDGYNDIGFHNLYGATEYYIVFGQAAHFSSGALANTEYSVIVNDRPFGNGKAARVNTVAAIGDLDADNFDDIIIGGHDAYSIVRGRADWAAAPAKLSLAAIGNADTIPCVGDGCVFELSSGDINGDGRQDLLALNVPDVEVFLGEADTNDAAKTVWPQTKSYLLNPVQSGLALGRTALSVGDVNGDAKDDVLFLLAAGQGQPSAITVWLGGDYQEGRGLLNAERTEEDIRYDLDINTLEYGFIGTCGDLDNDGLDEICYASEAVNDGAGALYVHY